MLVQNNVEEPHHIVASSSGQKQESGARTQGSGLSEGCPRDDFCLSWL